MSLCFPLRLIVHVSICLVNYLLRDNLLKDAMNSIQALDDVIVKGAGAHTSMISAQRIEGVRVLVFWSELEGNSMTSTF